MKKIFIPIIMISSAILFTVMLAVFVNINSYKFVTISSISNYDDYIKTQTKYGQNEPPKPDDALYKIEGFKPLINKYFDYAKFFSGNITYVSHSTKNYFLNTNGELLETPNDLKNQILISNKYAFKNELGNKFGIKDIYGNTLIEPIYDSYEIKNDTILMIKNNSAYIFKNKNPISSSNFASDVSLYSDSVIKKDNNLFDINFNPLFYKDYRIVSTTMENMNMIMSNDFLFGYISTDEKTFIKPQFTNANDFINGYATVEINDRAFVINKKGTIVFEKQNIVIQNYHNGYFCFIKNDKLGVMNDEFKIIVEPLYTGIKMNRAYGDYLIDNLSYPKFYSIKNNQYDSRTFTNIDYINNYFICQNTNKTYCLLNNNLVSLIDDCQSIEYSQNILMIKKNNQYAFYKLV